MSRKPGKRIVRAVTDILLKRDRLELRAADALLSLFEPKRRRPKRPRRQAKAKRTR